MAAVKQLRPKKLIRILQGLPRNAQLPIRKIDHDVEADVLYLSFDWPQKATDSETKDDGIVIHKRGKHIVGVTILEASKR